MIDWNCIETVLLDMDGTLLDLHFDNYFWLELVPKRYAEKHDMAHGDAHAHLTQQFNAHQGTLNWYCLDFWSEQLQLDIADLKQEITHKIAFRPNVSSFLRKLRDAGKQSVIVTNAHRDSMNIKFKHTALDDHVDDIFCSHDFAMPKENPDFWGQLQAQLPFNKSNTLLIDDSLAVLRSARSFGIEHLLSIAQPDSQKPVREIEEFHAIDDFSDIVPEKRKQNDPA